jgi:hypothetical protein
MLLDESTENGAQRAGRLLGSRWSMFGRQRVIVVREPGLLPPMRVMGPLGAVAGGLMTVVLVVAAIGILLVLALITLMTAGVGAAALGGLAYWKREQWTMPAYRWAKDRSGQWRMTPWSSDSASPSFAGVAAADE